MGRRKNESPSPTYYTTFQVAKMLGVSAPTVVNWVNAGRMVAHRTPGGHRRIRRDDVLEFARLHEYPLPDGLPDDDAASSAQRVLIVDDEHDFAAMVKEYLTFRGDYEVEVADSGFAAGLLLARFHPNLVVMDLMMPGMDGFESLRKLREVPEMRTIPVLACTAWHDPRVEERARREGFAGYLEKPLKLDELLHTIERLLAPGGKPA